MFYYYYHYFCCHNRKQKLYNWAKEKKQKTVMKKLRFVIAIALGSNCPGVTIRGQYNCPRWELSRGKLPGGQASEFYN